jgi:hypothetical protein
MNITDALAIHAAYHDENESDNRIWQRQNRELWTTVMSIITTHAKTTLASLSAERIEIEPSPSIKSADDLVMKDTVILRSIPEPKTPLMLSIQKEWIGHKGTITGLPVPGFQPPLYKCKMHGGPEFFATRDMLIKAWPS